MAAIPQVQNDPTPQLMAMLGQGQPAQPQQSPAIMQQISQVLGMQGSQDVAAPVNIPVQPLAPPELSFAPKGPIDVNALQQAQTAQQQSETPAKDSLFGGPMTESKQQRLLLLSAALMSPGGLADKLRLAALSQGAYSELQNSQMRDTSQKEQELERLRQDSEANRALHGAQTEDIQENTSLKKATKDSKITAAEADARKASTDADLSALQFREKELLTKAADKLDPTGAKRAQADLDKVQAAIALQKNQAASAGASARHSNMMTESESQKVEARNILTNPQDYTPAQHETALEILSGGKSALRAKQDEHTMIKKLYKESNPSATDQEAAQFALEHSTMAKGQNMSAAKTVMQTADPKSAEYKQALELVSGDIKAAIESRKRGAGATSTPAANAGNDAWAAARNSVKVGQQYTGPDGKKYTRNN